MILNPTLALSVNSNLLVVGTWQSGRVSRAAKFFLSRLPESAVFHLLDIPPFQALNDHVVNHAKRFTLIGIPPLDYDDLLSAVGHVNIRLDYPSKATQSLAQWCEEHPPIESCSSALLTEYALLHVEAVYTVGEALNRNTFRVWSRAAANSIPVSRLGLDT